MNIIGIGIDLVAIHRIDRIYHRYGQAFIERILTPNERENFYQLGEALESLEKKVAFLAKRFAAKEAVAKALGVGFRPKGIRLTEIGVIHDEFGKPHLEFLGQTKAEVEKQGVRSYHVSLSDEKEHAIAMVVLS